MTFLMGVRVRLQLARLAVRLDPGEFYSDALDPSEAGLGPLAQGLFGAGADLIQLQPSADSTIADAELADSIEVVRAAAYEHLGLVSVTDAVEVAAEVAIDVLHLDRCEMTAGVAAARQHEWALVGRSCRSRSEVDAAIAEPDVDYFFVGPDLIRYAAQAAPPSAGDAKPWFATGGITLDNLDEALGAGARRVCVALGVTTAAENGSSTDPLAVAQECKRRLRRAWWADPALPQLGVSQDSDAPPRFRRPGEPTRQPR